ncbi:MAG: iron-containing alcohol dehydrogenase [Paraglaciecola sp.]|uniref:iron-containing alcohol dehydrogenase n=1 Tax=Paraglaciecola sp. TaxID=1920173 RepID=UPI00273DAEB9|nr:iron-containing alcohol dehydrogenase [Paraglaciecola sp.]MDP5031970.1 iron-containing alcohol dehydrogenase [Paraglaciecola sp.]MDP5129790.1 iron-containing alcohol dehydrogenase [Paraglaciecola sp.]
MSVSFVFQTVNDIRCGAACSHELGAMLQQKFAAKNVLIITDSGLVKLGKLTPLLASLSANAIQAKVFDGVVPDPSDSLILRAAEHAQNADVIIGFGGGSSMDTAKLAAVLAQNEQPLAEMYGVEQVKSTRKPLVQIPTTAGTGSEVTPISVVTTGETTKSGVVSSVLYADLVLLDASLLAGMPAHITAETGVDAMVHAIEAFTSKIKKNPLSDNLAQQALRLLSHSLPLAYTDIHNLEHRQNTLLGAMLAGQAFANAPVAGVHALAYPLGGIFHLAHGLTNALMLPHVLVFNIEVAEAEYAQLGRLLISDLPTDSRQQAEAFIVFMQKLSYDLGLNKRLRDYGIKQDDLELLASEAMKQTRLLQNNPKPIFYDDALALYQAAW